VERPSIRGLDLSGYAFRKGEEVDLEMVPGLKRRVRLLSPLSEDSPNRFFRSANTVWGPNTKRKIAFRFGGFSTPPSKFTVGTASTAADTALLQTTTGGSI